MRPTPFQLVVFIIIVQIVAAILSVYFKLSEIWYEEWVCTL